MGGTTRAYMVPKYKECHCQSLKLSMNYNYLHIRTATNTDTSRPNTVLQSQHVRFGFNHARALYPAFFTGTSACVLCWGQIYSFPGAIGNV